MSCFFGLLFYFILFLFLFLWSDVDISIDRSMAAVTLPMHPLHHIIPTAILPNLRRRNLRSMAGTV